MAASLFCFSNLMEELNSGRFLLNTLVHSPPDSPPRPGTAGCWPPGPADLLLYEGWWCAGGKHTRRISDPWATPTHGFSWYNVRMHSNNTTVSPQLSERGVKTNITMWTQNIQPWIVSACNPLTRYRPQTRPTDKVWNCNNQTMKYFVLFELVLSF